MTGAARVVAAASAALPGGTAALAARAATAQDHGGMVPVPVASVGRADPVARRAAALAVRVPAAMPGGPGHRGSSGIRTRSLRAVRDVMTAGNCGRSR